jgi:hypothetical protein
MERRQKEEEERQRLAELAAKNAQELTEQRAQLEKETQLRREAEAQKAEVLKQKMEVERLAKKVRTLGGWVSILLFVGVFFFFRYYKSGKEERLQKDLKQTQAILIDSATAQLNVLTKDSLFKTATGKEKDTMNYSLIKLISTTDSVAKENDQDKPEIGTIVDSLYMHEFDKKKTDVEKFNRQDKIQKLKDYYIKRLRQVPNQIDRNNLKKEGVKAG